MMKRCLFVLGVVAAMTVLAGPLAAAPAQVRFVTIASGSAVRIGASLQAVILDADAWTALWRRYQGADAGPPPGIDFSREMVIALFGAPAGRPQALQIGRIDAEPQRLVVLYVLRDRRPLPDGEAPGAAGAPFHIVRVPRSTLPVVFVRMKTMPI